MKILVDTSIWIEFLKNNQRYYPVLKGLLENQEVITLECIFGELLQGTKNNYEKDIIVSYWENLPEATVEDLYIQAGIFSAKNKLISKGIGLIDCTIIIAAKINNARIWSLDKKLLSTLKKDDIYY